MSDKTKPVLTRRVVFQADRAERKRRFKENQLKLASQRQAMLSLERQIEAEFGVKNMHRAAQIGLIESTDGLAKYIDPQAADAHEWAIRATMKDRQTGEYRTVRIYDMALKLISEVKYSDS